MNESIVNFMFCVSMPCVCLIPVILIFDIVRFIQFLVKGPYLSKYTESISVKCTELIEVKFTKSTRIIGDGRHTYRKTAWIMRPSFSGVYNGKNLTFCRKKDWNQPNAEVGGQYIIYVQPGYIDCHDYYEEQEKIFLRKRRAKRFVLCNVAMILMAIWVVTNVYFSCKLV